MGRSDMICMLALFAEGEWYLVGFEPGQEEEAAETIASYAEDEHYSLSWQNIEGLLPEVKDEASSVTGA